MQTGATRRASARRSCYARDVHFAGLQRGEALLRVERQPTSPLLASPSTAAAMVLADVHVKTRPVAAGIGLREPGETGVDAATT